jgi:hypothetical protein
MSDGAAPPAPIWAYVKQVQQRAHDLARRSAPARDGLVYHYASLATLDAATREPDEGRPFLHVRASSVAFMNDTREYLYGRDLLAKRIARLSATLSGWPAEVLARASVPPRAPVLDIYCACFSAVDDDLSQWRGYGEMGRGCTLGIDRALLQEYVSGIGSWVTYDPRVQRLLADQLVGDYLGTMANYTQSAPTAIGRVAAWFSNLLPSLCMLFKNQAFGAEHEYRIIYSPVGPAGPRETRFRSCGSRIVPFVDLDLAGPRPVPLRSVRLGPAASDPRNLAAVKAMLAARGVRTPDGEAVPVDPSLIPFVPT